MKLHLEIREQQDNTAVAQIGDAAAMVTPYVEEDYWAYRVQVSDTQAVVGFPKFTTVGIGFQVEEDWNTNLPYTVDAEKICDHIWHNRGDSIPKKRREDVVNAIRLIQSQAMIDKLVPERMALREAMDSLRGVN